MRSPDDYRRRVSDLLVAQIIGPLDEDTPRVTVSRALDVTAMSPGGVLRMDVFARVEGQPDERCFSFVYSEWEDYTDSSPESMAEGLAVLIKTDIREEIATQRD